MQHVYLIATSAGSYMKIGMAHDVRKRVTGLQSANPGRLRILAIIENGGRNLERELQERFAHLRVSGEWFHADNAIEAAFEEIQQAANRRIEDAKKARRRSEATGTGECYVAFQTLSLPTGQVFERGEVLWGEDAVAFETAVAVGETNVNFAVRFLVDGTA